MMRVVSAALFGVVFWASALSQQLPIPKSALINSDQLLEDVRILSADNMEGRKMGTPGNARAREYIVQRFKAAGIATVGNSYLYPFDRGVNVVGYVKGKSNPDKFLVVSAHYDHTGIERGRIFNGANDNASGVGALLALAAYFQKNSPNRSILFVAFDAEESGLQGSQAFLQKPPIPKNSIIANINVDMIGRDKSRTLYAVGSYTQSWLKPLLEGVFSKSKVKVMFGHDRPELGDEDWSQDSDHHTFYRNGIPFAFFSVEDYDFYHTPNDDYETMMPDFYVGCVETILDVVRVFDESFNGPAAR